MFVVRSGNDADHPLVYSSFLKSLKQWYPASEVPGTVYFRNQHAIIRFLLEHAELLVMCFPEDPTARVGYILYESVGETCVVHWIYIEYDQRRKHYAADLIQEARMGRRLIVATHITDKFSILRHRVAGCKVVYDPYYITNARLEYARAS